MPKHVLCNVEDHRLKNKSEGTGWAQENVEDVTKVSLPTLEHPTSTVKAAGMVMDVDAPNIYHYNAMELGIHHNNGTNCSRLADPGKHEIEFRVARQKYNVALGRIELESMKVYIDCVHKSTEKGDIETDNPYGSTDKYSILRYVEEIAGNQVTVIDSMAGIIRINGIDYSSALASILD